MREQGKSAIGTTKRGIGPAYEAKMARRGVRMRDLLDEKRFRALFERNLEEVGDWLQRARRRAVATVDDVVAEYMGYAERLRRYVGDASRLVHDAIKRGRHVLFEGAQGALLDVDHGTYPYVTSSSTIAGRRVHERPASARRRSPRSSASPRPTRRASAAGRSRPS